MHHDLNLLINIAVVLCVAFVGGLLARHLRMPTLAGYLLAGLAIGPFTPGFVGDIDDIRQLAELGVIFMMFGVGLHFSLKDLWAVRGVAVPGAIGQILLATGMAFVLTRFWGWTTAAGLVVGLAISIASTVVLLRGLTDNGLLNTSHGQVAVGWLVLEDLATVVILVMMPALASADGDLWSGLGAALLKTGLFVAGMLLVGRRFLPFVLTAIARTRSRELFILAVMAASLGTAMLAAEMFGISLALGAFLAGVVIGESKVSHQVAAEALPFQEIFAVVFFVSVGMLANPFSLWQNITQVLLLTLLIIVGKAVTTILLGLVLPAPPKTMLVVAAGLSQIGEFSFIVGQTGVSLGLISAEQYELVLAGALISIILNPFLFHLIPGAEKALARVGPLWKGLTWRTNAVAASPVLPELEGHVVVVGSGRVGGFLLRVLERLELPLLLVEKEREPAREFQERGLPVLFGDASNSELLTHARLDKARSLIVTVPSQSAAELIVAAARDLAPHLPIVARASTTPGIRRLARHGARDVIHAELEGGLEIMRHALLTLQYSVEQVQQYTDAVRREMYFSEDMDMEGEEVLLLSDLLTSVGRLGLTWVTVSPESGLAGRTIGEIELRKRTGASIVGLIRDRKARTNPGPDVRMEAGDLVGMIGEAHELAAAEQLLQSEDSAGERLASTGTASLDG